ncbi:reverse transcriptase domain-containing protein [Tanacetum coccineum]
MHWISSLNPKIRVTVVNATQTRVLHVPPKVTKLEEVGGLHGGGMFGEVHVTFDWWYVDEVCFRNGNSSGCHGGLWRLIEDEKDGEVDFPKSVQAFWVRIAEARKPFSEAWERFKEMLRACPHHGFTELTQVDTFYNGLNENDQDSLNAAAGGNLLSKTTRGGFEYN